jgi:hypothetical protein
MGEGLQLSDSRRNFLKKFATVGAAGAVGAAAMHSFDKALAAPPPSSIGYVNEWNQMLPADVVVWADSSGNYYVKDNGVGSQPGQLIYDGPGSIGPPGITSYGAALGAGTVGTTSATGGIQEAINVLSTGGSIYIKDGIYNVSTPILITWGYSYYFIGDGVPSFQKSAAGTTTYNTPTDGTQIRGTAALNSLGGNIGIFTRTSGSYQQGALYFYHMAIMPAYATNTTNSTNVQCVLENTASEGSMHHTYDDVYFVPWGWTEAGSPISSGAGSKNFNSIYLNLGGAGTTITIGTIFILGMTELQALAYADYFVADQIYMNACHNGMTIDTSAGYNIRELSCFDVSGYYLYMSSLYASTGIIGKIFVEGNLNPANLINFTNHYNQLVQIGWVYIWNNAGSPTAITGITVNNLGTSDPTNLIYPCNVWTGDPANKSTGIHQIYPIAAETGATTFGATIATAFGAATGPSGSGPGVGKGGSNNKPTSTTTYIANEPVDVTIAAGTGQTITTKDNYGNVIDNAVATISHRLLLTNYSITVTATSVGTTTVVQATIGNIGSIAGTTATAQVGVNYLVLKRGYITDTVATGTMTTYDGSTNTGGNAMDSAVPVSIFHYLLEPGQIVVFGTAAPVMGSSGQFVQQ